MHTHADLRLSRARAVFDAETLGGKAVVDDILHAAALAEADPYRAATHNKGITNGISAVVLARQRHPGRGSRRAFPRHLPRCPTGGFVRIPPRTLTTQRSVSVVAVLLGGSTPGSVPATRRDSPDPAALRAL